MTADLQSERISRIGRISRIAINEQLLHDLSLDIVDFLSPFRVLGSPFWLNLEFLGNILVIKWDTDALKGNLEGPRMDFG